MSDHRAPASAAASPPGASAALIASCRAEPLAYASMSRDRWPAAAAERRRAERAINAIRPATTTTPSRIHSQSRLEPEEAPGVAETLDGADGAEVVALCVGGWVIGVAVALGLAETVAVRLGRLPIELVTVPPHPAARQPTTAMAASRESLFVERRMMIPPHCSWPSAEALPLATGKGFILSQLLRSFAIHPRVIP